MTNNKKNRFLFILQNPEPKMEHVLILTAKPDQNQNGNGNKGEEGKETEET